MKGNGCDSVGATFNIVSNNSCVFAEIQNIYIYMHLKYLLVNEGCRMNCQWLLHIPIKAYVANGPSPKAIPIEVIT